MTALPLLQNYRVHARPGTSWSTRCTASALSASIVTSRSMISAWRRPARAPARAASVDLQPVLKLPWERHRFWVLGPSSLQDLIAFEAVLKVQSAQYVDQNAFSGPISHPWFSCVLPVACVMRCFFPSSSSYLFFQNWTRTTSAASAMEVRLHWCPHGVVCGGCGDARSDSDARSVAARVT